jgi:hypothetical protein
MTTETASLAETRKQLVSDEYNSYSPDNFPGSKPWRVNYIARKALSDFDAAHPEIKAAIDADKAARDAAQKAYWASPEGVEKQMAM